MHLVPLSSNIYKENMAPEKSVYYSDYLALDVVLNAQHPLSKAHGVEAHDEMLFIVIHQAYELWFKQVLFELDSIIALMQAPSVNDNTPTMQTVVHRTHRINTILKLLVEQIGIMETMTSLDFLDFRDLLRPASGFQSVQWKELEARLGLRFEMRHGQNHYTSALRDADVQHVKQMESQPTLLGLLNAWLERMPYLHGQAGWRGTATLSAEEHPYWLAYRKAYHDSLLEIERGNMQLFDAILFGKNENKGRQLSAKAARSALFIMLHRGYPLLHMPFQLLVGLLDIDEHMATWRTRHMNMVHRMIGTRVGTGNSSGRSYLKAALDKHYIFAELAELNGLLLERRNLPEIPIELERILGFAGVEHQPE